MEHQKNLGLILQSSMENKRGSRAPSILFHQNHLPISSLTPQLLGGLLENPVADKTLKHSRTFAPHIFSRSLL